MRAGFILVEAVCQIPRKGPGAHNVVEKPDPGVGVGRCRYSPTCSDLEGFVTCFDLIQTVLRSRRLLPRRYQDP